MVDAPRARRLSKRIIQIVASTLEHQVKDPRLAMVTITDARLTADLREATVFYTVYGDENARTASAAALASARGVLRTAVGQQTGVRYTPSLEFVLDAVPEGAAKLEELLEGVRAADAEVASLAVGATYAGEADPYRKPREDDDLDDGDDPDDLGEVIGRAAGPGEEDAEEQAAERELSPEEPEPDADGHAVRGPGATVRPGR
jgi:ribosome-binding factor A